MLISKIWILVVVLVAFTLAGCEGVSPLAPSAVSGSASFTSPPPRPEPTVPPAFPQLHCSPDGAVIVAGSKATFKASDGDGNYSWSAPGGSPSAGSGSSFTTVFSCGGTTEYVTVTSGDGQRATCEIGVASPPQKES